MELPFSVKWSTKIDALIKDCLTKGDIGINCKMLLEEMVIKAESDVSYSGAFGKWLNGETSTVALRGLVKPFGNYWNDANKPKAKFDSDKFPMLFSNIVDTIDSASCRTCN